MAEFVTPVATSREMTGIPTGRLGVWLVIASEVVIFGGLVMCYLLYRLNYTEWALEAEHTSTAAGAINTVVLLTSSMFAVLAHKAVQRNDTAKAYRYLWYTIMGGFMFLIVKAYEYTTEIMHGYTLFKSTFWSFYYVATCLHALHVIIGMIILGIVASDVKKGKYLHRVENIGNYWHFVDMVWIFLFPLFYIAK